MRTGARGAEARGARGYVRLVATLLACWALVASTVPAQGLAYAAEALGEEDGAAGAEVSAEELAAQASGPGDPGYLQLVENVVGAELDEGLDPSQYFVTGVQARYVSQEYAAELAYNSRANVFFGYTLDELDALFEGKRYVFDLGEDGQTFVHEFEPYQDGLSPAAAKALADVAVGTGAIVVSVSLFPVVAGGLAAASAPAVVVSFFVGASDLAAIVSSAGVGAGVGALISGVVTGVQTGSVRESLESAALGAADGYKWGAVLGSLGSGAASAWLVKTGASELVEIVGTDLSLAQLEEGIASGRFVYRPVKCINESMAWETNEAGVQYVTRWILQEDGVTIVKGVFPRFESTFTAKLPKEFYSASYYRQFRECTQQLAAEIERNPELAARFSQEQLDQIKAGITPNGFTWHHNEQEGVMQLVDTATHGAVPHTGGGAIWARGTVEDADEALGTVTGYLARA